MPISGTDPALTEARLNLMRLGGSRLGYVKPIPKILINGSVRTSDVRIAGLSIRDILNGTPNTATFRVDGAAPTEGHEVQLAFGDGPIEFSGRILSTNKIYELKPSNIAWDCQCISEEWLLNRRKVTRRWQSTSASTIIRDVFSAYTTGFSTAGVANDLPVLDEFTVTNEDVTDVLDRVCKRIGEDWQLSYSKVLHVPAADGQAANTITDSEDHGMSGIAVHTDLSQVKTRQSGEGGGSAASTSIVVGQTTLPVDDGTWYSGGTVKSGPQFIAYTGKSGDTGTGSTVAGKPLSPSAPSAAVVSGTSGNMSVGAYQYKTAFVMPQGESEPGSASGSATIANVSAPGVLSANVSSGIAGNLGAGEFKYKVTFVTSVGETEAGSASAGATITNVTGPSTGMAGAATTGGSMANGFYWYAVSFYTSAGETLAALDSPGGVQLSGGNNAVSLTSIPTSADGRTVGRKIYRGPVNSAGGYRLVATIANNTATTHTDTVAESGLGAPYTGVDTSGSGQISLTSIPTSGDGRVTARKLYRTVANGTTYKLLTTIGDNSTTTHGDNTADGSLGADAPAVNTSGSGQVSVTSIQVGPSGTTARKLYRTEAGGSVYKALTTVAGNVTTTFTDNIRDSSLGSEAPTASQVGAAAAETTLRVAECSVFAAAGGWVDAGNQLLRFTGRSASSGVGNLTGIPASGTGAIAADIAAGGAVLNHPHLTGVSGILYPINQGDEVNIWVTRNDTAAQTFMATAVGGDGIHEADPIQDRRMSETEIIARCDAKLEELSTPLVTVRYVTRDITTKSGRDVTVTLGAPTNISGTFRIQSVTTTGFHATALYRPLRQVECSSRRLSFEQLLRVIKAG